MVGWVNNRISNQLIAPESQSEYKNDGNEGVDNCATA